MSFKLSVSSSMNLKIIKTDSPSDSESFFIKRLFYDSINIKFWL